MVLYIHVWTSWDMSFRLLGTADGRDFEGPPPGPHVVTVIILRYNICPPLPLVAGDYTSPNLFTRLDCSLMTLLASFLS